MLAGSFPVVRERRFSCVRHVRAPCADLRWKFIVLILPGLCSSICAPFAFSNVSSAKTSGLTSSGCHESRDNFQRRNLVPSEFEKESKVNRAARKVSNQMAGDDRPPLPLFARERLAGVLILYTRIRLPRFDCAGASVRVALVLYDGVVSEAF